MTIRTLSLSAAALCLMLAPALAAQPGSQSNCRSSFDNGQVRIACGNNVDPLFFDSGSRRDREEVTYTVPMSSAAPTQAGPNFCGAGYRYNAATGCEPDRR